MGLCGNIQYYYYSRNVNRGKTQVLASFFLLMILTTNYGLGIAPIKGNPFLYKENCIQTIKDIKRANPTKLHNIYYLELRCVERKANYLRREKDEPNSQIHTAMDIF